MIPRGINAFLNSYFAHTESPVMLKLKAALKQYPPEVIEDDLRFSAPTRMAHKTAFIDIDYALRMMTGRNCSVVLLPLADIDGNFYAPVFSKVLTRRKNYLYFMYLKEFRVNLSCPTNRAGPFLTKPYRNIW